MARTYKTPDVYVEEISVFPPSVAEVGTAIPAFIGYTETARARNDDDLLLVPTLIYSLLEYEAKFGRPPADKFSMVLSANGSGGFRVDSVNAPTTAYLLYYAVKMYFANGGGRCYIVSVGHYGEAPAISETKLESGLGKVELEDEPTMIVIPEAANLATWAQYSSLTQAALGQCGKLGDRVAILDVWQGDEALGSQVVKTPAVGSSAAVMRDVITASREAWSTNLKYGAAYYPYLQTTINHRSEETDVTVTISGSSAAAAAATAQAAAAAAAATAATASAAATAAQAAADIAVAAAATAAADAAADPTDPAKAAAETAAAAAAATTTATATATTAAATTAAADAVAKAALAATAATAAQVSLNELNDPTNGAYNTAAYNVARAELQNYFVTMPPSGAVAGVYAATDKARGVWKAPANVGLSDVIGPVVKITNEQQEDLNVDTTAGKSINALRTFAGKGTLVWGARTLAGNDNEWRYVSVRRFFNMAEESIKKSTYWAVFEPNDANTWTKVRGMIENYLIDKWRDGALAGATPKDAFFVKVGLGTTMNAQDILEGRMNVEIGMAVVRPAEFIILKFSHKLQTS